MRPENLLGNKTTIAFVGAGPTTLYSLAALLARAGAGFSVTIFESQSGLGRGTPYRPGWNDPAMLCNIASFEIPPLTETLLAWLARQSDDALKALGVEANDINDRAFVPRVALGQYFADQFARLIEIARRRGIEVDVRAKTRVIDVANVDEGILITVAPRTGIVDKLLFDHAVLATGHQWPSEQEVRPGYFLSPWPASALADVPATKVGIRGSSLTAIDAAVAVAAGHGTFVREEGCLVYSPHSGSDELVITMMSRKGLLPEADFYFPLPGMPLSICTPQAVEKLIEGDGDLLDGAFDLFRREMNDGAPDYFGEMGLDDATLEQFSDRYFAARAAVDPFEWAQANLIEAQHNYAAEVTVPWRYAILQMHEVIGVIVPHLEAEEFKRFNRYFKPVFVDNYAAVPHETIERMLALHRAGMLVVVALGDDYRIDTKRPEGGAVVRLAQEQLHYPVFIEATGQRPLSAIQFPFLTLLEQGVVRDEASDEGPSRGIAVDAAFRPIVEGAPLDRLFCLGIPFLMGRHPFVQGITSSYEMGEVVGEALSQSIQAKRSNRGSRGAPEPA